MQDFRKLRVWQSAHQLRLEIYIASRAFPPEERFGLTSQIRRSASSVCANIAESCGYQGGADSARFVQMALASNCETQNHLIAAVDLGYLPQAKGDHLYASLEANRRMLVALMRRMREPRSPKPKA